MNTKPWLELTRDHFTIIGITIAVGAGLSRMWKDAPWYAYLGLLAIAPLTALAVTGWRKARAAWILYWRNRRQFPPGSVDRLVTTSTDLLRAIRTGSAGITVYQNDATRLSRWAERVLTSARDVLNRVDPLPNDAYVIWLRADSELRKICAAEACNAPEDYRDKHIDFEKGDGLAGRVWESGEAAMHSARRPSPDWRPRPGCDNESYVCVPVGKAGGPGGVVGLGSDQGFEVSEAQVVVLEMFASILALVAEAKPHCDGEGSRS